MKKCETLRQYSRFVEIVRSYGHIDQLSSAVMVQIMEYIFVFTPCKRLAPTTKPPGSIRGGFDFCFSLLFFAFALLCVRYVFHCVIEDLEQVILFERLEYEAFRADLFGGIHGVIVCE